MQNQFSEPDCDRWSPDTQRAYEAEILREVEQQIARVADISRRDVLEVRLDGSYPHTQVVIRLWERVRERETTRKYPIWTNSLFGGQTGLRETPYTIGMLMTTWALGG